MQDLKDRVAVIVGAGPGISASLMRKLNAAGARVALGARDTDKLAPLVAGTTATAFAVDATQPTSVAGFFAAVGERLGPPSIVLYNASARAPGPLADLDPAVVQQALAVSAFGGFLVVQQAARAMLPKGEGTILLTGASASVKGFAQSAAFAMGKFALRGLAESAARELGPRGIHVAHVIIDGGVRSARREEPPEKPDSLLDPDAIAQVYMDVIRQPRSAWSFETDLRPWVERF